MTVSVTDSARGGDAGPARPNIQGGHGAKNQIREGMDMVIDYNEDDCMATLIIKDWPASKQERG